MGKFVIFQRVNGDYQFNLLSSNGQVILVSQGYASKQSCENGIQAVKTNSQDDSNFERLTTSSGKYYFNLKATNGQVVGTSMIYASEAGRESGIVSVKINSESEVEESQ